MQDNQHNMLVSTAYVYGSGFLQDGVLLALFWTFNSICLLTLFVNQFVSFFIHWLIKN